MQRRSTLRLALALCSAALLAACADLPSPVSSELQPGGALRLSVTPTTAFDTLDANGNHACGLTSAGWAYCWGQNSSAQLGDSSASVRSTPVAVWHPVSAPTCELVGDEFICTTGSPIPFSQITVGGSHTCALTSTGQAYCWGYNPDGRLGDSTFVNPMVPSAVRPLGGIAFTQLSAGNAHTCGLVSSGQAYCWGNNTSGQVGDSTNNNTRISPTLVKQPSGVAFASIVSGGSHSCALTSAGQAYCWGYGGDGQTGQNTTIGPKYPVAVQQPAGVTFASLSADGNNSCGLTSGGQAYCWGYNFYGQVGDGTTTTPCKTPVAVSQPSGVTFTSITSGNTHTCGRTSAGALYCWGQNSYGQLGDGTTTSASAPVAVTLPTGVTFALVHAGNLHTCALDASAGQAYCWGRNQFNQVGDGTTTNRSTPTAVSH